MTLRPASASWFELLTTQKDLVHAIESLSRTGKVELEAQSGRARMLPLSGLDAQLQAYRNLAQRYQSYWPEPAEAGKRHPDQPDHMLAGACKRIAAWAHAADPLIVRIEQVSAQVAALDELQSAIRHAQGDLPNLRYLGNAGPILCARLIRFEKNAKRLELPALALFKTWDAPDAAYMLVMGRTADIREIETQIASLKAYSIALPAWLPAQPARAAAAIEEQLAGLNRQLEADRKQLAAQSGKYHLAAALSDVALLAWIRQHADKLQGSERLAWVTGWSSDPQGTALRRALDAAGVRYILKLAQAPEGSSPPMVLRNPKWVRAFEMFAQMMGIPARNESDPSILLAFMVPLIFGFMFGDVGQGLIILAAGLGLGRRIPQLWMLVPGGIAAIGFGFLFGSVFSLEVPALWLRPLERPVELLAAAVGIGVAILLVGLMLDALQLHWRGAARRWWGSRAGLTLAYAGLLAAPFRLEGLWAAAAGLVWFILGSLLQAERRGLATLARGAAEFVEEILRLLVNTVSFARIGAFALAHAGLSAAIVELAGASGTIGGWIVLAVGNILVIGLEGLVVSIQTTRLMLFEFFIRFLTGGGREFKPLPPPGIAHFPSSSLRGQT